MSLEINVTPPHVGFFLKDAIIPDELSITRAAEILGVGRQALSALLNGRSSISPEMALRFEKSFSVKMETLLRMQARYDAHKMRKCAESIHVEAYSS